MERKMMYLWAVVFVISLISLGFSVSSYIYPNQQSSGITITDKNTTSNTVDMQGIPIYMGTSNGYVIKFENDKIFYFSGDTCLFGDMKWVIGEYYKPDVAFLSAGNVFTMDPIDATKATEWINPKYVIPYHYRIFPFLEQNMDEFALLVNESRGNGDTQAIPIILISGVEKEIEGVKVTWLGHGTFYLISPTGAKILIDPWFTPNPDTPAEFKNMTVFQQVDMLLITHGHIDHFDEENLDQIIELYNPPILSQWEVMIYLQSRFPGQYLMMNKGGRITKDIMEKQGMIINYFPDDMEITMVHADHSSSY